MKLGPLIPEFNILCVKLMKTTNFIICATINLYIIYLAKLAYVGIISKRELNSLVGIV